METEERNSAERRFVTAEMRVVKDDDGAMIIEGYPIVYEVYTDLWGMREIIHKGAATEALKNSDELVLWDHQSSQPMARRSAGTLEATEDDHGVKIRADVSKTKWGRDGYEAIAAGVITRMSFAFSVGQDKWTIEGDDDDRVETREILSFEELFDYSPVSYPAYEETEVTARGKDLAFRLRPDPEVSGDGGRALLEVVERTRESLGHDPWPRLE